MNFIHKKQCLPPGHTARARRFKHPLQIGDTGKDRGNLLEGEIGFTGKQARNGCLAGAGRPPEDHGAERAGGNHTRQHAFRPRQVFLASHFRKMFGAQAVRKRPVAVRIRVCRC